MAKKKRTRSKKGDLGNSIGLVSSLIGIFTFVTGVGSLPAILSTDTNNPLEVNSLFRQLYPSSSLYLIFFISALGIYGFLSYLIIVVYRWLAKHGLTSRKVYNTYYHANYHDRNTIGDLVAMALFLVIGWVLWFFLVSIFFGKLRAFYYLDGWAVFIEITGLFLITGLILAICLAARNAAWK